MPTGQKAYKDIVTDKIQLESYYRPLLKPSVLLALNQKLSLFITSKENL